MALLNVLKSRYSTLTTAVRVQQHAHHVNFNLLCATLPLRVTCTPSASQSYIQTRSYNRKKDVSHLAPLNFDFSEDLVKQEDLDPEEILYKYKDIAEINELEPHIRKLFTVEFANGREKLEHRSMKSQDKVVSLVGPDSSYERQVCFLTVKIRNLIPTIINTRQDKKHKAHLYERIAKRKKLLGYLRKIDYDRFLWLLKELKITYTPFNKYDLKKKHKRAIFNQECRDILFNAKSRKLASIRVKIEKEKIDFIKQKSNIMKQMDAEIERYGLNREEVLATYEKRSLAKQKLLSSSEKQRSGWKKLNDFIEKEKIQKEKEKWVF